MKLKNQRGASAVEFAVVLFPLVLLVFGIIDFGFLLYDKAMLTNASREGARAGIVARTTRLDASEIQGVVNNYLSDGNSLIPPLNPFPPANIPITKPASPVFGDELTVTVNYQYNYFFLSIIGISSKPLTAYTTMRYE
jgi:hypothetical protein